MGEHFPVSVPIFIQQFPLQRTLLRNSPLSQVFHSDQTISDTFLIIVVLQQCANFKFCSRNYQYEWHKDAASFQMCGIIWPAPQIYGGRGILRDNQRDWKGSSWWLGFICDNVYCISNVSFYSDHQYWNLLRSLTQLVSTSNKRSSSGEMKKRPEEGWYMGNNFDTCGIKELELWRLIFTPLAGGSVIFESVCGVWRTVAIKFWHLLNVWKCFGGTWRNDTTQFMSGVKELALMLWRLQLIDQLNRFLALQAPSWTSRYMHSHIRSKSPNIVKLGEI